MNRIALQMLVGDKAKYFALIVGLSAASLLTTQQVGIFLGYMSRTWAFIDDTADPDVWVMNPQLQFTDDHKRMADTTVDRVRGVPGVKWAVPMFKGFLQAHMPDGHEEECTVIGLDDATLVGGPNLIPPAKLDDLRASDSVFVDARESTSRLAHQDGQGHVVAPLKIGDTFEINDHQVHVAGFCKIRRPFFWEPVVYSSYSVARHVSPFERRLLCYVVVKAAENVTPTELCRRITAATGQQALTSNEFRRLTATYVVGQTGIAVNFGMAVLLAFIIGTAIAGQTFYSFTLDNLRQFGNTVRHAAR
jgi:putative ABC transport system permease protein